jgi:hypothetical protein
MTTRLDIEHVASPAAVDAPAWNHVLPDRLEDHRFFCACAEAVPEGYTFGARVVRQGDRIVGAVPLFALDYRLSASDVIDAAWARKLTWGRLPLRVRGFGSPLTDHCPLGVAPDLDVDARAEVAALLLAPQASRASANTIDIVKDVTGATHAWLAPTARAQGFTAVPTFPTARLTLEGSTLEDYLARLAPDARSYLKSWEKRARRVQIEVLTHPGDQARALYELYLAQQKASTVDSGPFDRIAPNFFEAAATHLAGDAIFFLYRVDGALVGFSFNYFNTRRFTWKYIGLQQPVARKHGLFFVNWLQMVRFCLDRGIARIDVGQTGYKTKAMLGASLHRNWIYIRHPNRFANGIVRRAGPKLSFEAMDGELAALAAQGVVAADV